MRISIALLTHNEATEFHWLMSALAPAASVISEIVVVDDFSESACVAAIRSYEGQLPIKFHQRALGKNFAEQRNYMKSLCSGDFVFYLDPDELPVESVVRGLPSIFEMMARLDIDACTLPRLNMLYRSEQPVHPYSVDPASIIHQDWGDQFRLLRNSPELHWTMPLDEYLTGMRRCYRFPQDLRYALLHPKTVARADERRRFYDTLVVRRRLARMRNSIVKRLPWRQSIEWVTAAPPF
jgi:glycosyltransferase involved in cell wall biosynthesis